MSRRRRHVRWFPGFFAALAVLFFAYTARAATITVTSAGDSGPGTLRNAIAGAASGDTIVFNGDCTIYLLTQLSIDKDLTIDGSGHTVTVSGNNGVRVLYISAGAIVSLTNLTVDRGNAGSSDGGGIYNQGTVSITGCAIRACSTTASGAGIYSTGTVTATGSTFSGNNSQQEGGGIYTSGTAAIAGCTISGNTAATGAGIASYGSSLTITNCTFWDNLAQYGAGLYNGGDGSLANCTFAGNTASSAGAGYRNDGVLSVRNTIIVDSAGHNCYNYAALTDSGFNLTDDGTCGSGFTEVAHSPLSGAGLADNGGPTQTIALDATWANPAIGGGDPAVCADSATVNSLDQRGQPRPQPSGSACDMGAFEDATPDQAALSIVSGDGQSAALGEEFGLPLVVKAIGLYDRLPAQGLSVTFSAPGSGATAVITGSPALTGADGLASVTAQAGMVAGAYAVTAALAGGSSVAFTVSNYDAIVVTNNANTGAGSLRQAILDSAPGGLITFAGDFAITLASALTINKNLTIDGAGHAVTISGNNSKQVFIINAGVTANLKNLTLINGKGAGIGGGVWNQGTVNITGCTISGCSGTFGGGIYTSGTASVAGCTISGNSVSTGGAGIYNSGTLSIADSTISGNTSSVQGGGIYTKGPLTVTNSTVSGNRATAQGGGIYCYGLDPWSATVTNCTLYGNTASVGGGLVHTSGAATLTLVNTIVAGNPGGNCSIGGTVDGGSNLANDNTCGAGFTNSSTIFMGDLGDYGGPTQTRPLLPGSSAIDAGDADVCYDGATVNGLDQRGVARPQGAGCDIGAYESRGIAITKTGGDSQETSVYNPFPLPLSVTVEEAGIPMAGMTVSFTAPASGPGLTQTTFTAVTDASGVAAAPVTANAVTGTYAVTAGLGTQSVQFSLTNGNTVTTDADSGPGSLRQTIADAPAGFVITFGGDYAITLTGGELVIDKDLTIDAGGRAVTVSGDNATRVFSVGAGASVSLKNLTVTSGNAGGGSGGGVLNSGDLSVTNCTFTGNAAAQGGAIQSGAGSTLTVAGCAFLANSATSTITGGGGAVFTAGELTAFNSTFSGNSAEGNGGGICTDAGATMDVSNCTLYGNTTSGSGGGIAAGGTDTVRNTIVAGSTGGNCAGTIDVSSSNLADDDSCASGFTNAASILLASPGDFGGPTQTMALLPGSAAIDAGDATVCADGATVDGLDQRGASRAQGAGCDIGAFESQGFALATQGGDNQQTIAGTAFPQPLAVTVSANNPAEPVDGGGITFTGPSSGPGIDPAESTAAISGGGASLAATANADFGPYAVEASAAGAAGVSFSLRNYGLDTTVTTDNDSGPGSLRQAIAAALPGGVVTFDGDYDITLATGELVIDKDLTVDAGGHTITVSGNSASRVFTVSAGANVSLKNLTVSGGAAAGSGGGLDNSGATRVENCVFTGNTATQGGGICNEAGAALTVVDSAFLTNTSNSSGGGGGIFNAGALTMDNGTLSGNQAGRNGGGMNNAPGATATVRDSTFYNNSSGSTYNGGGIYNGATAVLNVAGSTLYGNSAGTLQKGGGLYIDGTARLANCTLYNNTAFNGGGVSVAGTARLANCTLYGNTGTQYAGGMFIASTASLTVDNTIVGGSAGKGGSCFNFGSLTGGSNLRDDTADATCGPVFTDSAAILLDSLSDYGGPTQTMRLLPGSDALDAGDAAVCADGATVNGLDQRGVSRPRGPGCDVGAYEADKILVTAHSTTITYGDSEPVFDYTVSPQDTVFTTAPVCTVSGPHTDAGTYAVTCSGGVPADSAQQVYYYDGVLTIDKATPMATLTVSNSPVTYDGAGHGAAVGVSSSSVPGSAANILTGGSAAQTTAGTYAVTADFVPDDATNYATLTGLAAGNFSITKATPTATLAVTGSPVVYDGTGHGASVDVSASSVPGAAANILTGGAAAQTNAGTYAVTADFVPDDATNYATLTGLAAGDFVINKATPTATLAVTGSPVVYDGAPHGAMVEVIESSTPGAADNILTGGAATQTDIGTYAVTADFVPNDTVNYITLTGLPAGSFDIACVADPTVVNGDDDGAGSLRQAIAGACPGAVITFAGDYTITIAGQLTIGDNVTIDGESHAVTVSGDNASRVFSVDAGATVYLKHITVASGNAGPDGNGGGLDNGGVTQVENCVFTANTAKRGGGMCNESGATLTVIDSTLAGNTTNPSAGGAGIFNFGALTVRGSTFSGNQSGRNGGGLNNAPTGTVDVANSTFYGNSAATDYHGGGLYIGGTATLANCTLHGNTAPSGGGIEIGSAASLTVHNTVIAGSTSGGNCASAGTVAGGSNLADDATCGTGFINAADILLGPFGDYGGPTQTMALLPGSAAIDAGDATVCADGATVNSLDQRGVSRPQGSACDIGAFESQGFALTKTGGDQQTAEVNTAFAEALTVSVTATDAAEPVDGGTVFFTAPGSGASATLTGGPATVTGGSASVTAVANDITGSYVVTALAAGAADIGFSLSNGLSTTTTTAAPSTTTSTVSENTTTTTEPVTTTVEPGTTTVGPSTTSVPEGTTTSQPPGSTTTSVGPTTSISGETTTTTTATDNGTCELQLIPSQFVKLLVQKPETQAAAARLSGQAAAAGPLARLLRLLASPIPLQVCAFIGDENTEFGIGDRPVWSTDTIATAMKLRIGKTAMIALVFVNPFMTQAGFYTVAIGECVGTVEVVDPRP